MELFRTQKLSDHLYRLYDITDVQMYLAVGSHTAALIDTGCGFGDLYGVVRQLTDKPVIVLLTHGHVDHAMGAGAFSVAYMNRMDIPVYLVHRQTAFRVDYVRQSERYEPAVLEAMLPPPAPEHLLPMGDEAVFDLGGVHVRMFSCPGHTPGSMCALIEEERALITGDACNPLTFLFLPDALPISDYRESLVHLKKQTAGLFDRVYFSHGLRDGQTGILSDAVALCDEILSGSAQGGGELSFLEDRGVIAKPVDDELFRLDGVLMNIVYDPQRL